MKERGVRLLDCDDRTGRWTMSVALCNELGVGLCFCHAVSGFLCQTMEGGTDSSRRCVWCAVFRRPG